MFSSMEEKLTFLATNSYCNQKQVTQILEVDASSIRRWMREGHLKSKFENNEYFYQSDSVVFILKLRQRYGRRWLKMIGNIKAKPTVTPVEPAPGVHVLKTRGSEALSDADKRIAQVAKRLDEEGDRECATILAMSLVDRMVN